MARFRSFDLALEILIVAIYIYYTTDFLQCQVVSSSHSRFSVLQPGETCDVPGVFQREETEIDILTIVGGDAAATAHHLKSGYATHLNNS